MRHFSTVVGVGGVDVVNAGHQGSMCGVVTFEFVRHEPARFTTLTFDQAAKEAFSRLLVAPALHQDINGVPILIHRPPQILLFPLDGDHDFIQELGIPQTTLSFLEFAGVGCPKFPAPLPDGFIGDGVAAFGQEFFNFAEAQAEAMIQPHGVTDNFGRKTMALVAGGFGFHAAQSAYPKLN